MVKIKLDERAAFLGATGSGKTELAMHLLGYAGDRVLVIDPKKTFNMEGFKKGKRLPLLSSSFRMIYRPDKDDDDKMSKLAREIFGRGNARVYVDELGTLAKFFPHTTEVLEDIARTGRERNISLWHATQRPRWVPLSFFSESEVWFVFLLRDPRDRSHVRDIVGPQVAEKLPLYQFWYSRPGMEDALLLKLNLETKRIMEVGSNGHKTVS